MEADTATRAQGPAPAPPKPAFFEASSCLRLIRSLAVETHENWLEANRYLNMNDLKEMKKADLRQAA
jgi:transposase-like protein